MQLLKNYLGLFEAETKEKQLPIAHHYFGDLCYQ